MTSPGRPGAHAGNVAALVEAHAVRPTPHLSKTDQPGPRPLWLGTDEIIPVTDLGPTTPFSSVVARRRSARDLASPSLSEVSLVMARSGLARCSWQDGPEVVAGSCPAPSAGARQPITLVLLAREVAGLTPGAWVLDAQAAVLRPGMQPAPAVDRALADIASALRLSTPPPAAILAVAQHTATLSRYPSGISLLWREVGALLMLIHLSAVDLGLGSCFVGTCGVLHPVSDDLDAPVDLGAVALGRHDRQHQPHQPPAGAGEART